MNRTSSQGEGDDLLVKAGLHILELIIALIRLVSLLMADHLDIKLINFQLRDNSSMLKLVSCLLELISSLLAVWKWISGS
jgi:hypothetical protein